MVFHRNPPSIFWYQFPSQLPPSSLRVPPAESKANQLEVWVVCHCSHPGLGLWPLLLSWAQCKVSEGHWPNTGQGEGLGPAGTEGIDAFQWDAWFFERIFWGWGAIGWMRFGGVFFLGSGVGVWWNYPKKFDGNKHVRRWRCLLVTSWNWPCYDHTMTLETWSKHVKSANAHRIGRSLNPDDEQGMPWASP